MYNGDARFGWSFDDARRSVRAETPDVGDKVIVINITPRVSNDVIAIRSELPDTLKTALFDAMAAFIATEEGELVMDELYSWTDLTRADTATNQSLDAIRVAVARLGFTD